MASSVRKSRNRRNSETSTERLEARVLPEQKAFFKRAASLRGLSLTDFMIDSMHRAAVRTLEEHELITLAARERQVFVETLLHPPAPNRALQAAVERYKRMVTR